MGRQKEQRYAQRIAWAANAHRLGRQWRLHVKVLPVVAALLITFALWPHMPLRQLIVGFFVGAYAAGFAFIVAGFNDPQVHGDLAEQWTAEALSKVRGWYVMNGLRFEHVDVDHVVVTPSGVLAVETKYRYLKHDTRQLTAQRRGDLEAAARAAKKVNALLSSKTFGYDVTVTPVLMTWGRGKPDLPEGFKNVEGTFVVEGEYPTLWAHLFNAPRVSAATRSAIATSLQQFHQTRTSFISDREQTRFQLCWAKFKLGVKEERDEHANRSAQKQALRRRHAAAD